MVRWRHRPRPGVGVAAQFLDGGLQIQARAEQLLDDAVAHVVKLLDVVVNSLQLVELLGCLPAKIGTASTAVIDTPCVPVIVARQD